MTTTTEKFHENDMNLKNFHQIGRNQGDEVIHLEHGKGKIKFKNQYKNYSGRYTMYVVEFSENDGSDEMKQCSEVISGKKCNNTYDSEKHNCCYKCEIRKYSSRKGVNATKIKFF